MTNRRPMRALFALIVLSLSACGTPTVLEVKDYNVSCQHDSDCLAVYVGDVCKGCVCDNAAIAASENYIYEADKSGAGRSCKTPPANTNCAACAPVTVTCDNGTCKTK